MRELKVLTQSQANDLAEAMSQLNWGLTEIASWLAEHGVKLSSQAMFNVIDTKRSITRAPRSRALTYGR